MSLILTDVAKELSTQTNIKVNLILEIDGFPNHKFGTLDIGKALTFDMSGKTFDSGLNFDSSITDEASKPYITMDGTTRNITSQLNIDKGIEAVRSFTIELLDKDKELSEIFTPGHTVNDLLGQKAQVYLNFQGSDHPTDSLLLMEGVVGQYVFTGKNTVKVVVDHASQLKRQEIMINQATELNGALASSVTTNGTINVNDASGFISPPAGSEFKSYIKVNDELIEYSSKTDTSFTVASRAQLNTVSPSSHDDDSEVTSFYRIQGNAINLALKIMLSGGGYGLSKATTSFGVLTDTLTIANSILFDSKDIKDELGLVKGDFVQISGSDSNNITTTIKSFGKIDALRSYIVVNDNLNNEDEQTATVKFKSQYDTLPEGAGLLPTQLDVDSHLYWLNLFSSNFPDLDFFIDESVKVDEFVNKELYRPANLYSVPGNRPSVKMTIPPLSDIYTKTLDSSNIVSPTSININRSVNKYHYNTIVYRYDTKSTDLNKFLTGKIIINNDALERINAGKKVLKIDSQGLRRNTATKQILDINARRFLDRYKFAAEFFSIETFFSNLTIEPGDVVVVDGTNIYDSEKGSRDFGPRLFEVINKSMSIGSSKIKLDLLSTSFGLDGRFGVVAPASKIGSGATTTSIPLKQSFGYEDQENEKWQAHIGATIRVHSNDWNYNETTKITGFDPIQTNTLLCSPALSSPPAEDHIVDTCNYNDSSDNQQTLLRDMYLFVNPTIDITQVIDSSTVKVSNSDASKIFAGSIIEVHNIGYTNTGEVKVASVVNDTINFSTALSFTPTTNDKIQLVGFSENSGKPYRIL